MSLEAGRPVKFTSISLLDKLESLCYEISEKQRLIIKDNVQTPMSTEVVEIGKFTKILNYLFKAQIPQSEQERTDILSSVFCFVKMKV